MIYTDSSKAFLQEVHQKLVVEPNVIIFLYNSLEEFRKNHGFYYLYNMCLLKQNVIKYYF